MTSNWSHLNQLTITGGTILGMIPRIAKEFVISFDFYPRNYSGGWNNAIHFTNGPDFGTYGSRIPTTFFNKDEMRINTAISGNNNNVYHGQLPELNIWTQIVISQILENDQYIHRIIIDGNEVRKIENTLPAIFTNVTVYACDPWYKVQNGEMKNIVVSPPPSGK